MEPLIQFVDTYGYLVLFLVVMLEMIALPISGQAVMAYCGFLVWQGRLDWLSCILVAWFAAALGMTIAYWLGWFYGTPLIHKYGRLLHLGPKRMAQTERLMCKYGDFTLVAAYYIPGIRHFTGYLSGILRLPFGRFSRFAYFGAMVWAIVFVSLGRLLGKEWNRIYNLLEHYLLLATVLVVAGIVVYWFRAKGRVTVRND